MTIRPARDGRRYAESAGEGFVHTTAFEWLSRAGFVARAVDLRDHRDPRAQARDRSGRQADRTSRARCSTVAAPAVRQVLLTLLAIGLGGYSLWRLFRAALGHGPEGSDSRLRPASPRLRAVSPTARCASSRSRSCSAPARAAARARRSTTAGVLGWPGGHLDRRDRRRRDDRGRALPGLPRHHAEVPRRLEDRGDVPAGARRGSAASGRSGTSPGWSCSASSGSSSSRRRSTTTPTRRSVSTARWPSSLHRSYGPVAARHRRRRPDRVRALLAERRALPQDLSARIGSATPRSARALLPGRSAGSAGRSRSRSAAITGGASTRIGWERRARPAGRRLGGRRPAAAAGQRGRGPDRRRAGAAGDRGGAAQRATRTSTSPAGTSRPTSRSHATASRSSCAICSPSWPSASTCACSSGRARRCRCSGRRAATCARCAID